MKPIKCLDLGLFKKKLDQKQHIHIMHKCVCVYTVFINAHTLSLWGHGFSALMAICFSFLICQGADLASAMIS